MSPLESIENAVKLVISDRCSQFPVSGRPVMHDLCAEKFPFVTVHLSLCD